MKHIYQRYTKRILDIAGGITLIILLSPLLGIIAVIIKISSRGPVLYRQPRTGLGGEEFICIKFRTMTANNSALDRSTDDSMTAVGKVLRRFSVDELPQLAHVVSGKMSFIGPRPWMTDYYAYMSNDQRRRNSVRPGITGLAQAYGRNNLSIYDKISYDLEYIQNISWREDIRVVYATAKSIFNDSSVNIGKSGIYRELDELKKQTEVSG